MRALKLNTHIRSVDAIHVQLPLTADQIPPVAEYAIQLLIGLPEKPKVQLYTADAPRLREYALGITPFAGGLGNDAGQ